MRYEEEEVLLGDVVDDGGVGSTTVLLCAGNDGKVVMHD